MREKLRLDHIALAGLPLALTPALFFALAEGWINAGGGEKDILLAFPYAIWSLLFFLSAVVLIVERWRPWAWIRRAAAIATLALLALAAAIYSFSWLGVS
jgi:hypothetical protein